MVKKIIIIVVCSLFVLCVPLLVATCKTAYASEIKLASNYENVGNVSQSSKPSLSGYSYTQIMSVAPIRLQTVNGAVVQSFEPVTLGIMGNTLAPNNDNTYSVLTSNDFIDVFTNVVDNTTGTTKNTLFLQRRTIPVRYSQGNKYYTVSDTYNSDILDGWNIAIRYNTSSNNNSTEYNYKVTYFDLQIGTRSLQDLTNVGIVKTYIRQLNETQIGNVYQFFTDANTLICTMYINFEYGFTVPSLRSNELWVNCSYSLNVNEVLNNYYQEIYNSGFDIGKSVGYNEGKDIGYKEGKDIGYKEGYSQGLIDGESPSLPIITAIVRGMSRLFEIELLPDFTIGSVLFIALAISMVGILIHLFAK